MEYSDGRPIAKEYLEIRARELRGLDVEEYTIMKEQGDDDEDLYVNKWEKKLSERDKGPDRCLKGHALHYCKGTAILVLDENDGSSYNTMNNGPCMWKHCLKLQNQGQTGGGDTVKIDYLDEAFYACKFDCCHFAVHEACYGG